MIDALLGDLSRMRSDIFQTVFGQPTTLRQRLSRNSLTTANLNAVRRYRCEEILAGDWAPGSVSRGT